MEKLIKGSIMRVNSILPVTVKKSFINNTKSIFQSNADNFSQPLSDTINFGVGEDYGGVDLDAPENPNADGPGFKKGLLGIATMLTFPVSVPILFAYEKYKDKHKNDIKTNMNYDNIED